MYVFVATPLSYLTTVGQLSLIDSVDDTCCLPHQVYSEVVTTGLEEGHSDARRIEQAVDEGVLERHSPPESAVFDQLQTNDALSD